MPSNPSIIVTAQRFAPRLNEWRDEIDKRRLLLYSDGRILNRDRVYKPMTVEGDDEFVYLGWSEKQRPVLRILAADYQRLQEKGKAFWPIRG